ncbi:sodium/bile acid cotransporter 7-B/bile acid cotransporter 7-B [Cryptococcus neoformans A2-102-5]|uniref:Sodium/bile acid cotransporter 7-B/bile acid cotransporter 7-B n=1 Tax=Cryptococcus neoformans Tu259-1 TaxID=1230072 RepID=A0A854Q6G3_CRYNE|nr:sodium/bile acid cotransporter 7-B/bile acid cotransporter 7-B [Cryptococcus neoformans var. grubii Tu259-1]OXG92020.1 sodium/bile acid cotransporter 7-B/bile acid cotransporter 7-B [Cryptococcus neoformans var. grubii A2-102-5]
MPCQASVEGAITDANGENVKKKNPWYYPLVLLLDFLIGNWFLIGIGVVIVLAWKFPHVAANGGAIRSQYSITYGVITAIFLITGLTLSTPALFHQLANWRLHLFTQIFSFLFFSAIVFAIVNCVRVSGNGAIDKYVLVGMMVMSVMPTTVASNITMTRNAGGSTEAATMEVCVGNLLGTFITPLLCEMFFSSPAWSFGIPIAKGGYEGSQGLKEIYRQLARQLGLTLFVPLFVGQVILNVFPRQTKWVATTFRLPKVSTFLLLLLIWSVFSTQFQAGAFESISYISVIFICFVNFGLYVVFTGICVYFTRLPFLPESFDVKTSSGDSRGDMEGRETEGRTDVEADAEELTEGGRARTMKEPFWRRFLSGLRFDKKEATAICFCAAAKGMVIGSPTLSILYGGFPARERAILSIPLVLYQGQQVAVAQMLVYAFKRWNKKPDRLAGLRQKEKKVKKTKMKNGPQQELTTSFSRRMQILIPFLRERELEDEEVAEVGKGMGRGEGVPEVQEAVMKGK